MRLNAGNHASTQDQAQRASTSRRHGRIGLAGSALAALAAAGCGSDTAKTSGTVDQVLTTIAADPSVQHVEAALSEKGCVDIDLHAAQAYSFDGVSGPMYVMHASTTCGEQSGATLTLIFDQNLTMSFVGAAYVFGDNLDTGGYYVDPTGVVPTTLQGLITAVEDAVNQELPAGQAAVGPGVAARIIGTDPQGDDPSANPSDPPEADSAASCQACISRATTKGGQDIAACSAIVTNALNASGNAAFGEGGKQFEKIFGEGGRKIENLGAGFAFLVAGTGMATVCPFLDPLLVGCTDGATGQWLSNTVNGLTCGKAIYNACAKSQCKPWAGNCGYRFAANCPGEGVHWNNASQNYEWFSFGTTFFGICVLNLGQYGSGPGPEAHEHEQVISTDGKIKATMCLPDAAVSPTWPPSGAAAAYY